MEQKDLKIAISASALDSTLLYLHKRPYDEVVDLIKALLSGVPIKEITEENDNKSA